MVQLQLEFIVKIVSKKAQVWLSFIYSSIMTKPTKCYYNFRLHRIRIHVVSSKVSCLNMCFINLPHLNVRSLYQQASESIRVRFFHCIITSIHWLVFPYIYDVQLAFSLNPDMLVICAWDTFLQWKQSIFKIKLIFYTLSNTTSFPVQDSSTVLFVFFLL